MSGDVGYRAWGDFAHRHRRVLIEMFGIQKHGVPSYSTIRRIVLVVFAVNGKWSELRKARHLLARFFAA
ncbi:hypothetical protein [Fischerella sp. PCC 9605]|uniref:hypothetical protein n=1 Tax=Fischerella sp. PCC 9605 TaxID=1173024 RepID=UPI0009E59995